LKKKKSTNYISGYWNIHMAQLNSSALNSLPKLLFWFVSEISAKAHVVKVWLPAGGVIGN
jgi:hypothetical protein